MRYWIVAASPLALSVSGVAFAQSPPAATSPTSSSTTDELTAANSDIVVTARKREESIIDVPTSAVVLSDEALQQLVVTNIDDLVRNIPNAVIAAGGPEYTNDIAIRGQGAGRVTNSEAATGIYRNGIYVGGGEFGGRTFNRMEIFDLERFEVFRGPQGGVFGRNAVGGAVNAVTKRPTTTLDGFLSLRWEDVDRLSVAGAVGGPIIGSALMARVAAFNDDQDGGHVSNAFDGRTLDRRLNRGVRGTILARPTEAVEISILGEYFDQKGPSFAAVTFHPNRGEERFVRNFNGPSDYKMEEKNLLGNISVDLGGVSLQSTSFYRDRDARRVDDLDWYVGGRPVTDNWLADRFGGLHKYSQDLRLESDPGGQLSWILGLEYTSTQETVTGLQSGFSTGNKNITFTDDKSYSAYGIAAYQVTDALELGLEARGTRDKKFVDIFQVGIGSANNGRVQRDLEDDYKSFRFQPVVSLTYDIARETNLYARIAKAYRAGGFNSVLPVGAPLSFEPEDTTGYEAGVKGRTMNRALRYELSAYFMRTTGVQVVTRGPTTTGISTFIQNGGNANIYGLEGTFDLITLIAPGLTWNNNIGASVSKGKYTTGSVQDTQGGTALVLVDISNNDFPRVRELSLAVRSTVSAKLSSRTSAFIMFNGQGGWGGWEDSLERDKLANFFLIDARAGLNFDSLTASVFVKNLANHIFTIEKFDAQWFYNEPRVFGAEVRFNF